MLHQNKINEVNHLKIEAMKKLILMFVISLAFVAANTVTAKTIVKDTETFTISKNDNANSSLTNETSWTIEYGTVDKAIEVTKQETKKGEEYIVRNQFFEIRYVNTDNGFGVRKIKSNESKVDPLITNNVINEDEMSKQSLLSSTKLSEDKALSYIAGFVPYLLNENYKHLLK